MFKGALISFKLHFARKILQTQYTFVYRSVMLHLVNIYDTILFLFVQLLLNLKKLRY